ncbi:MAG: FecR domain-containing protein [Deltaproteobacteria bacterium]|nr:FecR domain-containing protein [Deltaproteobacteria bacterium]
MLTALVCLFVIAAAAALPPANAAAASGIARIDIAHGSLIVERSGVLKPFEALTGSDIFIGDTITAGDAAMARLFFKDNSFVNITAQTTLRVNQYVYESDKNVPERKRALIIARVLKGRARFITNSGPGVSCRIHVETDTAAVSGGAADFVVTALPGETRVAALAGGLSIKNILNTVVGTVDLYPNQKTVVREKKPPEKPAYLTLKERRALIRETIVR